MCQRLWLFNVLLEEHGNNIILTAASTIHKFNLPVAIRLAVPRLLQSDLKPYIVCKVPLELRRINVEGMIDGDVSYEGVYGQSLGDLK